MSKPFVSLGTLVTAGTVAEMREALTPRHSCGGTAPSSLSPSVPPQNIDPSLWERIKDHPCYSEQAHHHYARMHVAVAPACNIQCNYCNRKFDCANESRPGVVSERLTPEQAARKVVAVANAVPQLSVLGVAGPGDALYDSRHTFRTFELVRKSLPDLKFCVSTNGLALPEQVDQLVDLGIDHVTITINMVDPEVGAQIYPWIFYNHRRWTGRDASRILHERQMEGLERLVAAGVLVKVNSVMIPGINDAHLTEVNAEIRKRGAFLHNIMPLISDPAHGTAYGLSGQRGPTDTELQTLRDSLGDGARLMRHCRQCRADAVGLLGEDQCQSFPLTALPTEADVIPAADPGPRAAYRVLIEAEQADQRAATLAAETALSQCLDPKCEDRLVAVCTRGGGRINQHFGQTSEFQVFQVGPKGIRFSGIRRTDGYCRNGGDAQRLETIIAALEGVNLLFCSRIGDGPKRDLEANGFAVDDTHATAFIETAIAARIIEDQGTDYFCSESETTAA